MNAIQSRTLIWLGSASLLALVWACYWPGRAGPFVFDDLSNILSNAFLRFDHLTLENLWRAAFSGDSGPLRRPIPVATFALNHYFAGGYAPLAFKLTNIGIHSCGALAAFWLFRLIYRQATPIQGAITPTWLALAAAMIWALHPIQLTSVLYVVQRMTALSGLFTLLALVAYLKGRVSLNQPPWQTACWWAGAFPLFSLLGLYSKENAALLLLFIPLFEWTLFPNRRPWNRLLIRSSRGRRTLLAIGVIGAITLVAAAIAYVLPGYQSRPFTLTERLLTESRVLWFYLGLMLLPRLNQFGIHHDDIALSTSLLAPPSTLLTIIALGALLLCAIRVRQHRPLISLGLTLFLAGHLMESSVIPLEIAHEHRNYIPSLGIVLALVEAIRWLAVYIQRPALPAVVLPLMVLALAATTALRAHQWGDRGRLVLAETIHHPRSARTLTEMGTVLFALKRYPEAAEVLIEAARLAPEDPGYALNARLAALRGDITMPVDMLPRAQHLLKQPSLTPMTTNVLMQQSLCVYKGGCKEILTELEVWLRIIANNPERRGRGQSTYWHLLGRCLVARGALLEALNAFQTSHNLDPMNLHPLFDMASLFTELGQLSGLEHVVQQIDRANQGNPFARPAELAKVRAVAKAMRQSGTLSSPD